MKYESAKEDQPEADATGFTKHDMGSTLLFFAGVLIVLFGNSPAAAGGAFIGAGLCAIAEAIAGRPSR